jgi:hypothetical protein
MKVPIKPESVKFDELKSKLEAKFPSYTFFVRSNNFLVCKKTGTIGSNVLLKKDKIIVVGNFPSMGLQMLFTLSVVLLGFVIPIIIYFAAFHGKFKALEKEIAEYLQKEYPIQ